MKSLYIQLLPHQRAAGGSLLDPNLAELIFDLGAFRERMGIVFRLEIMDRNTLKVFYDDDNTFTALRLGYGERFISQWPVPEPTQVRRLAMIKAAQSSKSSTPPKVYPSAPWTGIGHRRRPDADWSKLMEELDRVQKEKPDPKAYTLKDPEDGDMVSRIYARMVRRAKMGPSAS